MLVATRTFITADGAVTAGATRVADDHPLARSHPASFAPFAGSDVERAQERLRYDRLGVVERARAVGTIRAHVEHLLGGTARAAEARAAPSADVLCACGCRRQVARPGALAFAACGARFDAWLRDANRRRLLAPDPEPRASAELLDGLAGDVEVVLSGPAREAIRAELWRSRRDGRETGGGLYGTVSQAWDGRLSVGAAGGPGRGAVRGEGTLDLDVDDLTVTPLGGRAWSLRGIWHSHPGGGDRPSRGDLETFARLLDHADAVTHTPRFVCVIATPDRRRGWLRPELHGFVVRRVRRFPGGPSRTVCQRAAVRIA